jgi:hypothetical protein
VHNYTNGFRSSPTTTYTCVPADKDQGSYLFKACSSCEPVLLASGRTCVFKSDDGLFTTICSQVDYGNRINVTSCYVGTFNPNSTTMPTTQSCDDQYCKVICFVFSYYIHVPLYPSLKINFYPFSKARLHKCTSARRLMLFKLHIKRQYDNMLRRQ